MRVSITASAAADLEAISDYIAADSPGRAESFAAELVTLCHGLADHPKGYPVFTIRRGREIRRCPYGAYLVFYSVVGDMVEVNHIVHGARDYARLLFPDI